MWSELPENCMTELTELTKTELETIENRNLKLLAPTLHCIGVECRKMILVDAFCDNFVTAGQ